MAIVYLHAQRVAARLSFSRALLLAASLVLAGASRSAVAADYRDAIGYSQLAAALRHLTPDGNGIRLAQVEAPVQARMAFWNLGASGTWWPDPDDTEFNGKRLHEPVGHPPGPHSAHATSVARLFYGGHSSMAYGVEDIDLLSANDFTRDILRPGSLLFPAQLQARVINHSWVGSTGSQIYDSELLRRLDWSINTDRNLHVVGVANGNPSPPLLGNAFNVLPVGRSDGGHGHGTVEIDSVYREGRAMPLIVAPMSTTSAATPIVSAAAVLLMQAAQRWPAFSQGFRRTLDGSLLRDGARPEVIKALLMAGARRDFDVAGVKADYRAKLADRTANGLDRRYGAGQVDVLSSYAILSGGEQRSIEDGDDGRRVVRRFGYDFDAEFGGAEGSNDVANYVLPTSARPRRLSATLVWNVRVSTGSGGGAAFNVAADLPDLDLELFDDTTARRVAASSSWADNTETLWLVLEPHHDYRLVVRRAGDQAPFAWRYALAWRVVSE
jgi:hypothetical protein